eukprot:7293626-Prorocentrum_lima.AAC.1
MEHGIAGRIASAQGYEPNGPGLERVTAQRLTVLTARCRHDPQGDVAMGRDGMSPNCGAISACPGRAQ